MKHTAFYDSHIKSNAKIVDFGGWALPINYGSQIKEHEAVRSSAGMFDVSHMLITDISGNEARNFLRHLVTNDINKLDKSGIGKALYTGMLNFDGYIIDDLIIYLMPFGYRIVSNAATEEKDMIWIKSIAKSFDINIKNRRDLAMIAVQGPNAISSVIQANQLLETQLKSLKVFSSVQINDYFYARTGYTGEDGLEIMLPNEMASQFWDKLLANGVEPCGLAARDTLRLEAGMNLYGHDMNDTVSPLECGMEWVVDLNDTSRDFIGKDKYHELKKSAKHNIQIGLILDGRGILREGQNIFNNGEKCGVITSGTFSPTMKKSIAIARVTNTPLENISVAIREQEEKAHIVNLPFVRNGKILAV
jgi:aminomethyltransferase